MASSINASTSGAGGVITTADNTGILNIQTAGTTAVTVDASQRVGIGTASPSQRLDVQATTGANILKLSATTTTNECYQTFNNAAGAFYVGLDNSTGATFGSAYSANFYQSGAYPMIFWTNNAERMRIDSSGVVLVGTSSYNTSVSATCKFQVQNNGGDWAGAFQNNSSGTTYGLYVRYLNSAPNNSGSEFLYCNDSGALRATIRSNGGLANYQANNANLSDERLKTDILPATTYLDKICSIPVVTFKYKDQTDEELNLGVIAQDVNKVAPELVDHNGFGETPEGESPYLAIYQTDLQYALMKCIQEQQTIINDLKARIETLEAK